MKGRQPISLLRDFTWLLLHLGVCPWLVAQLVAQPAANLLVPATSTASPVSTNVPSVVPPAKSPVDFFRELLAMEADEREERLAARDPADRKAILAKLQEYESLTPEERKLRLSTTQLHWYMLRLMKAPATNWNTILASVPKADRALVEERMNQWIILPPPLPAEILEYESTSSYFGLRGDAFTNTQKVLQELPPDKRRDAEEKLARWNALSPDEQRRMAGQFERFFELTPLEKEKTLSTLSEPEREQMKKTLQSFQQLPKATRQLCLQSFGRFARMSSHERQQFLKNVERWREMSPSERDAWQRLVRYLAQAPPMPQGLDPLPPALRLDPNLAAPATPDESLATNKAR
jgi:hypothetical protein